MQKLECANNNSTSRKLSLTTYPFDEVPDEMKQIPQWVCWKKDDTARKVPINPKTLEPGSPTDPTTWTDFNKTRVQYVRNKRTLAGIGFVFTKDVHLIGIDLDKVRDPNTGQWNHGVEEFISRFTSYTELSQSGTGCHIILKGNVPDGWRKRASIHGLSVEMYDDKHYFVMTGQPVQGTDRSLNTITNEALEYLRPHFEQKTSTLPPYEMDDSVGIPSIPESDEELFLEGIISDAEDWVKDLFNGDKSRYDNDESRADLALCRYLVPYCDSIGELDRLFRRSGLYQKKDAVHRKKWDDREDYRLRTFKLAKELPSTN